MQQLSCSCRRFLLVTGFTILTVGYTFLGAYIFRAVDNHELSSEQKLLLFDVEKMKNDTITDIFNPMMMTGQVSGMDSEILATYVRKFIDELTVKLLNTFEEKEGSLSGLQKKDITFKESLFFSFSLLTTIGSGQSEMVLKSDTAKGIVFPYAAVGIPLMLVWLMMLGTSFAHSAILIYNRVCCFCYHRRNSYSSSCCTTGEMDNIVAPFLGIVLLLLLWLVLGIIGLVKCLEESWGYLDAALYVFKTLTTIGYTSKSIQFSESSEDDKLIKFILHVIYIWFGLVLIAALIRMMFLIIDRLFRSKNQESDGVTY